MSETIYEGFEKMGTKKKNKEQVPPVPSPEQQQKKQGAGKHSKKSHTNGAVQKPDHFKSLEEALKAVSQFADSLFTLRNSSLFLYLHSEMLICLCVCVCRSLTFRISNGSWRKVRLFFLKTPLSG